MVARSSLLEYQYGHSNYCVISQLWVLYRRTFAIFGCYHGNYNVLHQNNNAITKVRCVGLYMRKRYFALNNRTPDQSHYLSIFPGQYEPKLVAIANTTHPIFSKYVRCYRNLAQPFGISDLPVKRVTTLPTLFPLEHIHSYNLMSLVYCLYY